MTIRVKFTNHEISQCRQAAMGRWQLARVSGIVNQRKDGGRDDYTIDFIGVKAEMAVSKVLKIDYSPHSLGVDDGADLYESDVSIDVKATFHKNGKMLFKSIDSFKADICVLVVSPYNENEATVVGWATKSKFKEKAKIVDLGHGDCFVVEQHELLDLRDLWAGLTKKRLGE